MCGVAFDLNVLEIVLHPITRAAAVAVDATVRTATIQVHPVLR
jgi:hypothetical protein